MSTSLDKLKRVLRKKQKAFHLALVYLCSVEIELIVVLIFLEEWALVESHNCGFMFLLPRSTRPLVCVFHHVSHGHEVHTILGTLAALLKVAIFAFLVW